MLTNKSLKANETVCVYYMVCVCVCLCVCVCVCVYVHYIQPGQRRYVKGCRHKCVPNVFYVAQHKGVPNVFLMIYSQGSGAMSTQRHQMLTNN
jgi:hypothetical protein